MNNFNYKHIAILCTGTLLEVYDSYVFATLMTEINKTFFPFGNDQEVFSIIAFSTIFIIRPISGILWGILGDNQGRTFVFRNSMLFMAILTCLIGLLPSYNQIGLTAPVLLLGLRAAQGISISGELPSAVVLCYEQSSKDRYFINHGILYSFIFGGIVLANSVLLITNSLNSGSGIDHSITWRIPFICGGLLGIIVYYFRRKIVFVEQTSSTNIKSLFKNHYGIILASIIINCLVNLSWFYFSNTSLILNVNQINKPNTAFICGTLAIFSCLVSAYLLHKYSTIFRIWLITSVSLLVHLLIYFLSLTSPEPNYVLYFYYAEAAISGLVFTTVPLLIISHLPLAYRNSIYTISVNFSTALMVGILPLIVNLFIYSNHLTEYLMMIGIFVIIISFLSMFWLILNFEKNIKGKYNG